jgi:signal transduction histidine kinase
VATERAEFLAMTAHELRGPLSLLQGFSDLLHSSWRELDDEERDEMLETLVRSSSRLRRLVEDLLTASRLEAQALDVRPQPVELASALAAAAADFASGIDISCPPDARAMVDPVRLQQMVANYLDNAVRHGAMPISVRVDVDGSRVDIRVTDSGAGVDDAMRSRLFQKFAHGGSEGSSGLGLYLVRALARAQQGDAFLDVDAPDGTTFVLRLEAAR